MKVTPALLDTTVSPDGKEWIPNSLDDFFHELNHIVDFCKTQGSLALFRGHRSRDWLLDSTFARSLKKTLFGIPAETRLSKQIAESAEFHSVILNLFLLKFGVLARPSKELEVIARQHSLDAWFELMKRIQQHPGEDASFFLKGTNLLDWTTSPDVALYFANEERNSEGAIFICDTTATGKTLQILALGAILDKMRELGGASIPLGAPLLFSPPKQLQSCRAKNQQAMYFAQMDLRYDMGFIWARREAELSGETILIKLIIPAGTEDATREYLAAKAITSAFIYPDSENDV